MTDQAILERNLLHLQHRILQAETYITTASRILADARLDAKLEEIGLEKPEADYEL